MKKYVVIFDYFDAKNHTNVNDWEKIILRKIFVSVAFAAFTKRGKALHFTWTIQFTYINSHI